MKKYIGLVGIVMVWTATACDSNEACYAPSLTQNLHNEWMGSRQAHTYCIAAARDGWESCSKSELDNYKCQEELDLDVAWCNYYRATSVNNAVAAICCARPFIIEKTPNDENHYLTENEEDTDGDGISDYKEFEMGMNPCSRYSHSCEVPDGTLDYDGDGMNDADDDDPTCNPQLDMSCLLM